LNEYWKANQGGKGSYGNALPKTEMNAAGKKGKKDLYARKMNRCGR